MKIIERCSPSRKRRRYSSCQPAHCSAIHGRSDVELHDEDRGVVTAATAVKSLASVDEPVATIRGSTLDLLYYCDRLGFRAFDAAAWNIS